LQISKHPAKRLTLANKASGAKNTGYQDLKEMKRDGVSQSRRLVDF
jgi:hypothetical protein